MPTRKDPTPVAGREVQALMRAVGVVSLLLLVLGWLALDDITTDDATTFVVEYWVLGLCGLWFSGVAAWLFVRRRRLNGVVSLAAVALAVLAFWSLPHHYAQGSAVNYLGLISIAWFLGLAIWLVAGRSASLKTKG